MPVSEIPFGVFEFSDVDDLNYFDFGMYNFGDLHFDILAAANLTSTISTFSL